MYRNGIFQQAGTAIFLFGNKNGSDGILEAPGMYQEYELAKANDCYIIPLASTGFVAERIYDEIVPDSNAYSYLDGSWDSLKGMLEPDGLSKEVLTILDRIKRSF